MMLSATRRRTTALYILVLGLCFLAEVDKCIGAKSTAASFENNTNNTTTTTTITATRNHNGRMLNSVDTNAGEFPFFAQWGGCGATLIWDDILLTSASCNAVSDESLLVGAHASHKQNSDGDSVRRKVVARLPHSGFDPETLANNFMILKLEEKISSLPHVWIDPTIPIPENAELYVVGFGFTASLLQVHQIYDRNYHHTVLDTSDLLQHGNDDDSNLRASVLQKAKVSIVPHAVCNAYDQYAGFIDDETMICASDDESTCLGDNGGPLCMMVNNECLQIGIVSFGESCSMGNRPTVFSSITPVHGWIEKNVCALSSNPPSTCRASVKAKEPILSRNNRPLTGETAKTNKSPTMAPSSQPSVPLFFQLPEDPNFVPRTRPSIFDRAFNDGPSLAPSNENDWEDDIILTNTTWNDEDDDDYVGNTTTTITASDQEQDQRNLLQDESFFHVRDEPVGIFRLPKEPDVSIYPNDFVLSPRVDETTPKVASDNSIGMQVDVTFSFLSSKKLGECEGDCDSDDDCEEGLYCFFKDSWTTTVPGCSGSDTSRTDYCTKKTETSPTFSRPLPILFVFPENPPDISNLPLQRCQGDCDRDSDCAEGLVCYQRPPHRTTIPGCEGISTTRTDFCVDLDWRNAPLQEVSLTGKPTPSPTSFFDSLPLRVVTPSPTMSSSSTPSEAPTKEEENVTTQQPTQPMPTNQQENTQFNPPTNIPTFFPTKPRRAPPSNIPTFFPTKPRTAPPTNIPTFFPTKSSRAPPTNIPTFFPTKPRTAPPTNIPTFFPTKPRTAPPTNIPTFFPTNMPTNRPQPSALAPSQPVATNDGETIQDLEEVSVTFAISTEDVDDVSVTFAIYFDPWPQEVSWKIEEASSTEIVASVPAGTYQSPQDKTLEVVTLRHGRNYKLTIQDSGSDGIAGIGTLYEIFLTDNPDILLLDGNGIFENTRSEFFHVPTLEEYPSSAPKEITVSPAPTVPMVKVYLIIVFDNWHQETAWMITDESDPSKVFAEATYDTYRSGETVTEEIALPLGGSYTFTIRDFFNDGIKDGEYLLTTSEGDVIFTGNGDFGSSRSHTFTL